MLNKVMIIGRLGRDPELRYTQSGSPVATLNVATDESYTDRDGNKVDRTEWHRVSVFQRQAENCANFLAKGSLISWKAACKPANGRISRARIAIPQKSRPSACSFLTARAAMPPARAVVAVALKTTTARPLPLRLRAAMLLAAARVRRADAAVMPPKVAAASLSPWTTISARPFLPKPPTWMMCRSRG